MRTTAILALALALATPAPARTPVYGRTKCVGLYCWIVEAERPVASQPATWCARWKMYVEQCSKRGWTP